MTFKLFGVVRTQGGHEKVLIHEIKIAEIQGTYFLSGLKVEEIPLLVLILLFGLLFYAILAKWETVVTHFMFFFHALQLILSTWFKLFMHLISEIL